MSLDYTYFQEHWLELLDVNKGANRFVPDREGWDPKAKKILAFVPMPSGAIWVRFVQPFYKVNRFYGDRYNIAFSTYIESAKVIHHLDKYDYDCVILQRQDSAEVLHAVQSLKRLKVKTIYEVDDDLFNIPPWNPNAKMGSTETKEIIKSLIKAVDHLVVSTKPLKELYSRYKAEEDITIIPNGFDTDLFSRYAKTEYDPNKVVIGWTGSHSHMEDLRIVSKVLPDIIKKYPQTQLLIGGWLVNNPFFKDVPPERLILKDWTTDIRLHMQNVAGIDIGVCPLVDIPFNRCKSNLKYLELAGLGVPAVCSKVYPYLHTIDHGVDGYLVSDNPSEWEYVLSKLIEDIDLRKRIGRAAQQKVLAEYTQQQALEKWFSLWQKLGL